MIAVHTFSLLQEAGGEEWLFGNPLGRQVFASLQTKLDGLPAESIAEISLAGIRVTDASFARESVISLAKLNAGRTGIFLSSIATPDIFDNWDYAAKAKGQAISVEQSDGTYKTIGPELTAGIRDLFEFAINERTVTTHKVAQHFDISSPNASAKLKKLAEMGLLLGRKETAETGGLEYVYRAIRRF